MENTNLDKKIQVEYLWHLQRQTSEATKALSDHMAKVAIGNIFLSQNNWNKLFAAWEQANNQMQAVGRALNELHGSYND